MILYNLCMRFVLQRKLRPCYQNFRLTKEHAAILANSLDIMKSLTNYKENLIEKTQLESLRTVLNSNRLPSVSVVPAEARHAAGDLPPLDVSAESRQLSYRPYKEHTGLGCDIVIADYQPLTSEDDSNDIMNAFPYRRVRCTLFSSVRLIQFNTGAHYKYKDIASDLDLNGDGIYSGNGSGGMGANHFRKFPGSRVIFNSKLSLEGDSFRGLASAGPGAYIQSGEEVVSRCINYKNCWENPTDLSERGTWEYFISLINLHQLDIKVLFCDAEIQDKDLTIKIENLILEYISLIFIFIL